MAMLSVDMPSAKGMRLTLRVDAELPMSNAPGAGVPRSKLCRRRDGKAKLLVYF